MRVHWYHGSAPGCVRMHWDHGSALRWNHVSYPLKCASVWKTLSSSPLSLVDRIAHKLTLSHQQLFYRLLSVPRALKCTLISLPLVCRAQNGSQKVISAILSRYVTLTTHPLIYKVSLQSLRQWTYFPRTLPEVTSESWKSHDIWSHWLGKGKQDYAEGSVTLQRNN